jgi:DNA-binding NarL/FixJ family response regulator
VVTERGRTKRVLIADDQPHVRAALADLVASDDRMELIGVAADAEEAIEMCTVLRPDVAVLDVKMPGGGGPAAAQGILGVSPDTVVVALSAHDDQGSRQAMRAAGAADYVLKGGDVDDLLVAIRAAGNPGPSAISGGGDG